MATTNESLGGRLALLNPDTLSTEQRALYDQLQAKTVPWAEESGFQAETNDKKLIGPFNSMLRSPEIGKAIMEFDRAEQQHTSLSEKVRQIVILVVGAVWQADYELYAHIAVAHKAGLPDETIRALAAGQAPNGLTEAETLAYTLTKELAITHQVADRLYEQAVAAFGEKGIFDLVALVGQYMSISALLNTFAVPAPEES